PITKAVPHYLRQVTHELVIVFESIALNADDRTLVRHADEEVTALGIEECSDSLEHSVRNKLVVLPIFFEAPTQRRLELQRLRFAALYKFLGIAVTTQILVENEILECFAKFSIISYALIKIKVRIDDLLDYVLHFLIEGKPDIFPSVHPCCSIERGVIAKFLHHLAERHAMFWT